jgi:hypothetical protein
MVEIDVGITAVVGIADVAVVGIVVDIAAVVGKVVDIDVGLERRRLLLLLIRQRRLLLPLLLLILRH